jgi:methylmalonyl-CoA carboxyltransferase large subunit
MSKVALEKIAAMLEGLQQQVAALADRITVLEQQSATAAAAPEVYAPAAAATTQEEPVAAEAHEEISQEILLAISAAVAAYLGQRAHIRAVRLIATTRWSQEGRVSIQASHYLSRG